MFIMEYDSSAIANNIAILCVNTPFTYTTYVQVACSPNIESQANEQVVVVSWASERLDGTTVNTLKQASILIVSIRQYY